MIPRVFVVNRKGALLEGSKGFGPNIEVPSGSLEVGMVANELARVFCPIAWVSRDEGEVREGPAYDFLQHREDHVWLGTRYEF